MEEKENFVKTANLVLKQEQIRSKVVHATHKIEFIEFVVDALGPDGGNTQYYFLRPILVDNDEKTPVMNKKCFRSATPFDSEDVAKVAKKVKPKHGFIHR